MVGTLLQQIGQIGVVSISITAEPTTLPNGGYARSAMDRQSQQVIALAATGQPGMAVLGQIRLTVVPGSYYVPL